MKIAILIHAHKDAALLKRLVERLKHPLADVYINVDAKADITSFRAVLEDVVFLENRVDVVWGKFSQVQQILNSYDEISRKNIDYSHILFISGQDYPVINIETVVRSLLSNADKSYLDYHQLGTDPWFLLMKKRYEYWHFLPKYDIRSSNYVKKILVKLGFKRKYPIQPVYYGSCWMCLNWEAVTYVLNYTRNNPAFVRFNEQTACADELYFQSILVNSPLKTSLENNIHRYIDWSDQGKRPKTLTMDDLEKIKSSDAWFARKVDPDVDADLMDELDRWSSE